MEKLKLIIDTDTGVDDAIAIMMASADPTVEIAAITAVAGNTTIDNVVRNIGLTLEATGIAPPYFRGCEKPFRGDLFPLSGLMGDDGLGNASHVVTLRNSHVQKENAVLALIRLIRMYHSQGVPFEIVTLGPLTNLALAVRIAPDIVQAVPRLVMMAGTSAARGNTSAVSEFNLICDADAGHIVLSAGFKDVWVLPWETSLRFPLGWNEYQKMIDSGTARSRFFQQISAVIAGVLRDGMGLPGMPMPDPLAMAVALEPSIVTESDLVYMDVETSGSLGKGLLVVDWHRTGKNLPNANLVTGVDTLRFQAMLSRTFENTQEVQT